MIQQTLQRVLNMEKLSKIEQSSMSLKNQKNSASEVGSEDDDAASILETQDDELKA